MSFEVVEIVNFCVIHGEHESQVCIQCYDNQAKRVEKESAELRVVNTSDRLRAWAIAETAKQNGSKDAH